jgi:transposase
MGSTNNSQRRYPPELRERAVRMVQEGIAAQNGQRFGVVARVARQLGIGTESLRQWVNQAEVDAGQRPGTSTADGQRIAELEREVRELRRANDILKAASIFFATELDGRPRK